MGRYAYGIGFSEVPACRSPVDGSGELKPNKVHGFSTDFCAEFCLCMPFGAERNKTPLA